MSRCNQSAKRHLESFFAFLCKRNRLGLDWLNRPAEGDEALPLQGRAEEEDEGHHPPAIGRHELHEWATLYNQLPHPASSMGLCCHKHKTWTGKLSVLREFSSFYAFLLVLILSFLCTRSKTHSAHFHGTTLLTFPLLSEPSQVRQVPCCFFWACFWFLAVSVS